MASASPLLATIRIRGAPILSTWPVSTFQSGRRKWKQLPLSSPGSYQMVPPWLRTISREMARPSPVPGVPSLCARALWAKRVNSRPRNSASMPGPSSLIVTWTS